MYKPGFQNLFELSLVHYVTNYLHSKRLFSNPYLPFQNWKGDRGRTRSLKHGQNVDEKKKLLKHL
jgi:hypothetical protein